MKHEFSDALRADPERFDLARSASELLDRLTIRTVVPASAKWGVAEPIRGAQSKNRPLVTVEVSDREGTRCSEILGERERDNAHELGYRIAHLWGDLLEERSFRYFESRTPSVDPAGAALV